MSHVKYYDPEYHLLVQDIIYTTYYEADPELLEPVQLVEPHEFSQKVISKPVDFK